MKQAAVGLPWGTCEQNDIHCRPRLPLEPADNPLKPTFLESDPCNGGVRPDHSDVEVPVHRCASNVRLTAEHAKRYSDILYWRA